MLSLPEAMREYHQQLQKGAIQVAYKGLMDYMMQLRTHLSNRHPDYVVSGSLYSGYMDMTYFSFFPKSLKERNLKIAIVFLHEAFRFEVWLAAFNKPVQTKYWQLIKDSGWDRYRIVASTKGADSILEHVLVDDPDFGDLDSLTSQIESETLEFIENVKSYLSNINMNSAVVNPT